MDAIPKFSTQEQLLNFALLAARFQMDLEMRPEAALRYGLIGAILAAAGITTPAVISGFRTHHEQRELRDFGRPTAKRSWHTRGLAYDLDRSAPGFPYFVALWKALGGRSGLDFSDPDPSHVDFPIAGLEPDPSW